MTYGHNGETHQDGIGHETAEWFPIISWTAGNRSLQSFTTFLVTGIFIDKENFII